MKGDDEYRALSFALEKSRPACQNDWRFLVDEHDLDTADLAAMRAMCVACPLRELCEAYASVAKPPAGMWAGTYYPTSKRRRTAYG